MDEDEYLRCPGGPVLVRGASSWVDDRGQVHPVRRPVVAVCRCLRSSLAPWCDGTHKLLRDVPLDPPVPGRARYED